VSIVKARLVTPHQDVEGPDYHEWIITGSIKADARGWPNPRVTYSNWFEVVCNNPDCTGFGYINKQAVTHLLDEVTS